MKERPPEHSNPDIVRDPTALLLHYQQEVDPVVGISHADLSLEVSTVAKDSRRGVIRKALGTLGMRAAAPLVAAEQRAKLGAAIGRQVIQALMEPTAQPTNQKAPLLEKPIEELKINKKTRDELGVGEFHKFSRKIRYARPPHPKFPLEDLDEVAQLEEHSVEKRADGSIVITIDNIQLIPKPDFAYKLVTTLDNQGNIIFRETYDESFDPVTGVKIKMEPMRTIRNIFDSSGRIIETQAIEYAHKRTNSKPCSYRGIFEYPSGKPDDHYIVLTRWDSGYVTRETWEQRKKRIERARSGPF